MKKTSLILMIPFLLLVTSVAGMVPTAHATVGADCRQDSSVCDSYSEMCDLQTFKCVPIGDSGVVQPATQPAQATQSNTSNGTGFTALAPIPGLTDQSSTAVVNSTTLANFFNNLYKYLIGFAATLAVIMIIWGGLEISTKDSVSKQTDGKERIYNAIFGLVLVLSPVLVFSIINPAILNLSLDLPALHTSPSTGTTSGSANGTAASQTPTTDTASGCSVIGTAGIFKTASCPTQTAVTSFNCNDSSLSQIIPSCKSSLDPITHACLDKTITVYCAGGTSPAFAYYIYSGETTSATTITPRDQAAANQFTATCTADGGVPSGPARTILGLTNVPCTTDMNIPPINVATYGKNGTVSCVTSKLTCN
ncbi:MAG TPA: pilin, partial [Candidatus Paceibacterota bacterium]|nr:pilin [Candidatus Paceibacterota bacterium]